MAEFYPHTELLKSIEWIKYSSSEYFDLKICSLLDIFVNDIYYFYKNDDRINYFKDEEWKIIDPTILFKTNS